ncbi:hypothetical protein SAMN04487917_103157 [Arthrobacter sp. yr096]|uniref:hypothetical protein n=1 Tax=Arthrobacter sp. yr096 TaxID=1761750 RepID=UPI0008BDA992|nr:hypothetical protein [Arthrobacter sp. yr096]SEI96639.1 hypothetical protein SAMN04487917_103157 [Arthrobacter sp. yr096]
MQLLGVVIAAGLLIVATIALYLLKWKKQRPVDSDPESERALRDFRHGKTLGQSHYVGLDNTGHWR